MTEEQQRVLEKIDTLEKSVMEAIKRAEAKQRQRAFARRVAQQEDELSWSNILKDASGYNAIKYAFFGDD